MNANSEEEKKKGTKRTAAEVRLEYLDDDDEDEETEEADLEENDEMDDSSDTLRDTEEFEEEEEEEEESENEIKYAYEPCATHNLQLVLKDGFKLAPEFENLIKKVYF